MSSIVISSVTANAFTTNSGTAGSVVYNGTYYPANKSHAIFGRPPDFSDIQYREAVHEFAGNVNGVSTTRMNTSWGHRTATVDLIFVSDTKNGVVAAYDDALTVFQNINRYNITSNGKDLGKFKLVPGSARPIHQDFLGGKYIESHSFQFRFVGG